MRADDLVAGAAITLARAEQLDVTSLSQQVTAITSIAERFSRFHAPRSPAISCRG
ncbi:MAG: hypothetical protein U0168_25955 [Nannocystaceae bacterium]